MAMEWRLGPEFRAERKRRGRSAVWVAGLLHVDEVSVYRYESGQRRPSEAVAEVWAAALGLLIVTRLEPTDGGPAAAGAAA